MECWLNLTKPQKKALVALSIAPGQYHSRVDLARKARGKFGPGFPIKTMITLRKAGLAEPEHPVTVGLVSQGICTCACDRWRITSKGQRLVMTWNVKVQK